MKIRYISFLLALSLLVSCALAGCSKNGGGSDDVSTEPEETEYAPDFTVYDENGNAVSLSGMRGKPVVVNFWASWCSPCKVEMPAFDATAKDFEGRVEFMMVNLTDGVYETVDEASGFVRSQGFTFPVYYDKDGDAQKVYDVRSIPTTLFIDAEGRLVTSIVGRINADTIKHGISMIYTEVSDK